MIKRMHTMGIVLLVALMSLTMKSCVPEETSSPATTTATVRGNVSDAATTTTLSGATVTVTNSKGTQSQSTDSNGDYVISMNLEDAGSLASTMQVTRTGYINKTLNITLTAGQDLTQNVTLNRDTSGTSIPRGTGLPNTIAFIGASRSEIAVYGVGGNESSVLTFEVRDSLGIPIDATVSDTVVFTLSGPTGTFITPPQVMTNAAGRVATTINSGTQSGSVQMKASLRRDIDNALIESLPIRLLVHGGMPDSNHISVAATILNVPGLNYYGLTSIVTAYLGDVYGNPVAPGTAVHFTTNQGIITTSGAFTGSSGQAQGTLYSALPIQANGFGTVTVWTKGISGSDITASMPILFSGEPVISAVQIVSGSLNVDNTTQGTVSFRVTDGNGNPSSAGTTIAITVAGASAVVSDVSPDNSIPDTQSQYWTQFSFVVSKNQDLNPPKTGPYTITIVVTHPGPYGGSKVTLQGVVN